MSEAKSRSLHPSAEGGGKGGWTISKAVQTATKWWRDWDL